MTKSLLEYSKDDNRIDPLQHLLEIRQWGTKWKSVIDKTNEWATWRWINAKILKQNHYSNKQ